MDAMKYRKLTVAAATLMLLAAQENRGFSAYLKQTGPSPLRFSMTTAVPVSFVLPAALVEPRKSTSTNEIAAPATTSAQTNGFAAIPEATSATNSQSAISGPESPARPTSGPPASEMLIVSPQMLTEYFKPVSEGTNSAGAVIVPVTTPVPVGFTPPLVKPSSRATYNTP